MDRLLFWVGVLCAYGLLALPLPWEPRSPIEALLLFPTDLALVVLLLWIPVFWLGARWCLALLGAILIASLVLFRGAESLMTCFWARHLEIWGDLAEAWGLGHLLLQQFEAGQARLILIAIAVGAFLALVLGAAWVRGILKAFTPRRMALLCTALLVATALRFGAGIRVMSPPVLLHFASQLLDGLHSQETGALIDQRIAKVVEAQRSFARGFPRLAGADVHLLIVESYGRQAFRGGYGFAPWLRHQESALNSSGYRSISSYGHPSVCGGGSAFSHMEFLAGFPVPNRRVFNAVLQSEMRPLPRRLKEEAGYFCLGIHPAMPIDWPEGQRFYGFDVEVHGSQIPYTGFHYHFGGVPDQAPLAQVLKSGLASATGPVFLQYVSVISHAPFTDVPPYFEDWAHAALPDAFDCPPLRHHDITWLDFHDKKRVGAAYMDCIRSSLRCMLGYCRQLKRPSLVIIIGDHQPPGLVQADGREGLHDVPVHLISNRPELLEGWEGQGFSSGLVPGTQLPSFAFSDFATMFSKWAAR